MFEKLGRPVDGGYPQKKVSLWEAIPPFVKPTSLEIEALSEVLEAPAQVIERLFGPGVADLAVDVFERLARSSYPSLVAVCFASSPRAPFYPELMKAVQEAISNKMSFAMVVPYPPRLAVRDFADKQRLENYYEEKRQDVIDYCYRLMQNIPPDRAVNVSVLVPDVDTAPFLLYPHVSRPVIVLERHMEDVDAHETSLYEWVKTETLDTLQSVGSTREQSPPTEVRLSEAFFREVINVWETHGFSLPREAFSRTNWRPLHKDPLG